MKHISLDGLDFSRLGLGCMGVSAYYTGAGVDDAKSIRTIHRALDLGVTSIDTAEYDSSPENIRIKGIGEIGVVGVSAAIANAVYHATGRRIRSSPITVEQLL